MENQTFKIDFKTGVVWEFVGTLVDAKDEAFKGMALTGEDVVILDENNNEITRSKWYGVAANNETLDDYVVAFFGEQGYYESWSDELAELL